MCKCNPDIRSPLCSKCAPNQAIAKTEKEFLKKLLEKYEDECIEETATYFHASLDSLFDDIKKRIKELD